MNFFAPRQKHPYIQTMAMIICKWDEFLYESIDPEEFLFPPEECIPPDNEDRRD